MFAVSLETIYRLQPLSADPLPAFETARLISACSWRFRLACVCRSDQNPRINRFPRSTDPQRGEIPRKLTRCQMPTVCDWIVFLSSSHTIAVRKIDMQAASHVHGR